MSKDTRYPVWLRVIFIFPLMLLMGIVWAFIMLFSAKVTGVVLYKTGCLLMGEEPDLKIIEKHRVWGKSSKQ